MTELIGAFADFAIAATNLVEEWEKCMPSTDNDFNETINTRMNIGYPFDKDFAEVANDICNWYWDVVMEKENYWGNNK